MQAEAVKEAESGGGGGWWGWATGWVSGEGDTKEEEAIVMPTGELIFTSECPNVSAISEQKKSCRKRGGRCMRPLATVKMQSSPFTRKR